MSTTRDKMAKHLAIVEHYARAEILTALTAPHRQLVNLLVNRSDALAKEQKEMAELDAFATELAQDEAWGSF
jgi:hypothetical protein